MQPLLHIPIPILRHFYREMQDADGLLTAFIPLDKTALDHMPALKTISINATGYNFVDLEETRRRDIPVCAIGEYCTQEVADHTMALMLALTVSTAGSIIWPPSRWG